MQTHPSTQQVYTQADVQAKRDNDHIRILAICHYVTGGLAMLTSLLALIYIVIGIVMLTGTALTGTSQPSSTAALYPIVVNESVEADALRDIEANFEVAAQTSHAGHDAHDVMPPTVRVSEHGHTSTPSADMDAVGMGIVGMFFIIGGVLFFLLMVLSGIMQILSGRFMVKRKYRAFSLIIAGLNLMSVPLGTTLGVFTLIVLLRPSVTAEYEAAKLAATETVTSHA